MKSAVFVIAAALAVATTRDSSAFQAKVVLKVTPKVKTLVDNGDYIEAIAEVTAEQGFDPNVQAWILLEKGDHSGAFAVLEKDFDKPDLNPDALLTALTVIGEVSPGLAWERYKQYVEVYPESLVTSVSVRLYIVRVKLRLHMFDEAVELIDQVLAEPAFVDYMKFPGQKVQDEQGKEFYIVSGADMVTDTLMDVATTLQVNKRGEDAEHYLDRLFSLVPETSLRPGFQMQRAHAANAAGNAVEALMMTDRIESNYPEYVVGNRQFVLLAKGAAYQTLGQLADSLAAYQELAELCRTDKSVAHLAPTIERKLAELNQSMSHEKRIKDAKRGKTIENIPPKSPGRSVLVWVNVLVLAVIFVWYLVKRRTTSDAA